MPPSETPNHTNPEAPGSRPAPRVPAPIMAGLWFVLSAMSTVPAMIGGMALAGPGATDNPTAVALVLCIVAFTLLAGVAGVGTAVLAYATKVTPDANTRRHRVIDNVGTIVTVLPLMSVAGVVVLAVLLMI